MPTAVIVRTVRTVRTVRPASEQKIVSDMYSINDVDRGTGPSASGAMEGGRSSGGPSTGMDFGLDGRRLEGASVQTDTEGNIKSPERVVLQFEFN